MLSRLRGRQVGSYLFQTHGHGPEQADHQIDVIWNYPLKKTQSCLIHVHGHTVDSHRSYHSRPIIVDNASLQQLLTVNVHQSHHFRRTIVALANLQYILTIGVTRSRIIRDIRMQQSNSMMRNGEVIMLMSLVIMIYVQIYPSSIDISILKTSSIKLLRSNVSSTIWKFLSHEK